MSIARQDEAHTHMKFIQSDFHGNVVLMQIPLLSPLNKQNGYVQVPHSIQVLNQMINTLPWPGKGLCNFIQINEYLTDMVHFTLIFMSTKFCVNVREIFPSECCKSLIQI